LLAGQLDVAREVVESLVLQQPRVVKARFRGQRVHVSPARRATARGGPDGAAEGQRTSVAAGRGPRQKMSQS